MKNLVQPRLASREASTIPSSRPGIMNRDDVAPTGSLLPPWRDRLPVGGTAGCQPAPRGSWRAFTLIELLAVIAIIATIAALIIPVTRALKRKQTVSVAQAELKQVETAIEYYKSKTGFYPPDNPGNPVVNQLYYELEGTILTNDNSVYFTLDGSTNISVIDVPAAFTGGVAGFANSGTSLKGTDDKPGPVCFISDLKPNQLGSITLPNDHQFTVLACSQSWPLNPGLAQVKNGDPSGLNPWRYVSTNPTNNPGSYDLWVDVLIGGATNSISNWSQQPQLL